MFVITLRFADKSRAPSLMDDHNAWIRKGFEDGVFLLVGSLQPAAGGMIVAHGATRAEIESRVQDDPFVAAGVVTAEIAQIVPGRTDERLAFLRPAA
ncbi:YciI family protein [Caulobacter sp. UNC279MFTsu5.1]|uniref:YciI family protein n=1 Tax=Caulobacter sp. UNC279MFTsu5.1 TaxID=1502775 RepID=UPI0008F3CEAA|nr:YciI family protein [Caulobacter sp. UNC279MFTsu5.1]SFI59406.1 YCII-related domain-containing protein [Caulobacter sp. UNC279MFTsu5.1]